MQFRDALFNWLQIQVVWEARPNDRSAHDTATFFEEMLREDHGVTQLVKEREQDVYRVQMVRDGHEESHTFPCEAVDKLLHDIQSEPKYNQSFE